MPKFLWIFNVRSSPSELVYAAAKGRDRDIREMLADGIDPNTVDSYDLIKATPLYYAAREGKLKAVAALLEGGADVEFGGPLGLTPFWKACTEGHLKVAQLLLDHGADINAKSDISGCTALQIVASEGNARAVTFLLERGANPALRDDFGRTARYYAVAKGNRETINALLSHGKEKVLPPMSLHAPIRVKRIKLKSPKT